MAFYVLLKRGRIVKGKDKLLYLIKHYKKGNYTANDFCDLYTNAFVHETDDCEFTDEDWVHLEQFMNIVSRYSANEKDFIKYPKVYNDTKTVDNELNKLCEYLRIT